MDTTGLLTHLTKAQPLQMCLGIHTLAPQQHFLSHPVPPRQQHVVHHSRSQNSACVLHGQKCHLKLTAFLHHSQPPGTQCPFQQPASICD